ncbi:MAG: helix-turn-helix domain-containing protein [Micrococcales bacterium]|nr:helix-turn-helix domain-containing protein [Micrococcales bacterium]
MAMLDEMPTVHPSAVVFSDGSRADLTSEQAAMVMSVLSTPDLLSPNQAAELLGVSRPMVMRWIAEGVLPDVPTGTHHKVPRAQVLALRERRAEAGRSAVRTLREAAADPAAARTVALARAAAALKVTARDQ